MNRLTLSFDQVNFAFEEGPQVAKNWSLSIPSGTTSLVGRNGTGKSTFLLLAAGRLFPQSGQVRWGSHATSELTPEEIQVTASVVYQNMEFENEDSLATLLETVWSSSQDQSRGPSWISELVRVFELEECLGRRIQVLSKGQMQRAIIVFSLLFGTPIVVMDEPVFALEGRQKATALDYLRTYAQESGRTFLFSVHELELSQRFSEHLILMAPGRPPKLGPTKEMFTRENLEEAYQTPLELLKKGEELFRSHLMNN
ncbi:MAG: ABC transporter ATP-binding protein [Spirochaetales bacterium]|nr:ABC transporter ATP-binding protein [Spirochaetales bacterium]